MRFAKRRLQLLELLRYRSFPRGSLTPPAALRQRDPPTLKKLLHPPGDRPLGHRAATSRLDNDSVDKEILDRMNAFRTEGAGYLAENSRPQTIGYGLVDSPLLQLAWDRAEKVHEWTDLPVDRDQLLTTVSLHRFTGSGATAAHTLVVPAHQAATASIASRMRWPESKNQSM